MPSRIFIITLLALSSRQVAAYQDPRQLLLTFPGYEHVCGDGWQLWPIPYILDHFSLWVLPAVILISHFLFPPLPWENYAFVIFHAIGDPIDSLWSILARQEAQQRLYRAARDIPGLINPNDHKYIATVWSAYEEVGWQDASSDLHKSLVLRNWRAPDREEMYHIMLASHELSSNRLESQLTTWVAIMALVSALITAYIRTVEQNTRIDNQTAHTIAVVALLFIFIPLVKISGNRLVQVDFDRSSGYRKVAPKSPGLYFRNGNGPCQPAK